VYLLGTREAIGRVFHHPNTLESRPTRRAMIFGGSSMALEVAKGLEAKDVQVSIVDPSEERCEFLASQLDGATVLKGDFTSTDLMREEGVDRADVFMALTGEDEKNIILCLLAKRMGCRRVLALANRLQYVSLAYQSGVDVVVSPSVIAINKILQFVRRGRVANVVTLPEGQAEIIEVEALETSDLVSSPIKDLRLPRGILVGAVTRGQEVIIPTGDTRIDPGDKVAMVVSSDSLKLLERVVSVKLDYW
jgi:trk system potassium uptake protein TrkA